MTIEIKTVSIDEFEGLIPDLANVLCDAVIHGASVSFMADISQKDALDYWKKLAPVLALRDVILIVALDQSCVVGTVHARLDMPPNQPHRADISKLLVCNSHRRQGLGSALMCSLETELKRRNRTLVVLDTAGPEAERLYQRLGYQYVGVIPNYALLPDGTPCQTTYFYKQL